MSDASQVEVIRTHRRQCLCSQKQPWHQPASLDEAVSFAQKQIVDQSNGLAIFPRQKRV